MNNNYNNNRGNGQRPQNRANLPQTGRAQYRQGQTANGQYQYQRAPQGAYPPVRHRSRKQAQKAAGMVVLAAVILVMLLISVIIFAARCATGFGAQDTDTSADTAAVSGNGADLTAGTDAPVVTDQIVTEPPETQLDAAYEYIEKTAEDVHRGYQILVNYQNAYNFDGGFEFATLYSAKNGNYKVSNTTDALDKVALTHFSEMMAAIANEQTVIAEQTVKMNDIIVTSSDRTYEFQEQLYGARVDQYGEEYAGLYVAMPGHSEHHTGLALDLAIYTDGGHGYTFDDITDYPTWLKANAHKYGFIERYQADKTAITKIAYENWHYRYIGKPHAFYITANALCLEEYIDLLRNFTFENKHLAITDDEGTAWEIYFVPANTSGATMVPVPKHYEWEVSGNNVDGFIVTIKK